MTASWQDEKYIATHNRSQYGNSRRPSDAYMRICVSKLAIIGSDDGLSPSRRKAIINTSAGISLILTLGPIFSEMLSEIYTFSFKKMHLKMSSADGRQPNTTLNADLLTIKHLRASLIDINIKIRILASRKTFQNVVCNMAAISFEIQCVNGVTIVTLTSDVSLDYICREKAWEKIRATKNMPCLDFLADFLIRFLNPSRWNGAYMRRWSKPSLVQR